MEVLTPQIDQRFIAQHTAEADISDEEFARQMGVTPKEPIKKPEGEPIKVAPNPIETPQAKMDKQLKADVAGPGKGLVEGVAQTGQNIWNSVIDIVDGVENFAASHGLGTGDLLSTSDRVDWSAYTRSPNDSFTTKATKAVTEYALPVAATWAAGGGPTMQLAASAATDLLNYDPKMDNLAKVLRDNAPVLKHIPFAYQVMDTLANKPTDSEMQGRFKNMLIGMGLQAPMVGIMHGISWAGKLMKNQEIAKAGKVLADVPEPKIIQEPGQIKVEEPQQLSFVDDPSINVNMTKPSSDGPIINLNNDNVIEWARNYVAANPREQAAVFRPPKTFSELDAETQAIVNNSGELQKVLDWRLGDPQMTDAQVKASHYLMENVQRNITDAGTKAFESGADADLVHLGNMVETWRYVNDSRAGSGSATGRALNAHKIDADIAGMPLDKFNAQLTEEGRKTLFENAMKAHGGKENLKELASVMQALTEMGPEEVNKALLQAAQASKNNMDKFKEVVKYNFVNGLLTLKTGAVAMASNTFNLSKSMVDNYAAMGIGWAKAGTNAVAGKNVFANTQSVTFDQANAYLKGSVSAFMEGLGAAAKTAVKPIGTAGPVNLVKVDMMSPINPMSSLALGIPDDSWMYRRLGNIVDASGYVASRTTQVTASADAFIGTMAYRGKRMQDIIARAESMNLPKEEYKAFVENSLKSVTVGEHEAASDFAKNVTLAKMLDPTSESFFERAAAGADQFLAQKLPLLRTVFPFFRTNANIIQSTIENSPLGFMAPNVYRQIMKGGAEGDLALAKVATGTAIVGAATYLAHEGYVTGPEPSNWKVKEALKEGGKGWQSDSFHVAGQYTQFKKADPASNLFRLGAVLNIIRDHVEDDEYDGLAKMVGAAVVDGVTPEMLVDNYGTFLNGLGEMTQYEGDSPEAQKFATGLAARMIPMSGTMNDLRKVTDPWERNTMMDQSNHIGTIIDQVINRYKNVVPWLSKDLPPKMNVFGEYLNVPGGWTNLVNPFSITKDGGSPLVEKLLHLSKYYEMQSPSDPNMAKLNIDMPPKVVSLFQGVPVKLTPQEYERYVFYSSGKQNSQRGVGPNAVSPFLAESTIEESEVAKDGTLRGTLENVLKSYKDLGTNMDTFTYNKLVGKISEVVNAYRKLGNAMLANDPEFMKRFNQKVDEMGAQKENTNFQ